jgi:RNA-directed DNA polymerase
MQWFPGDDLLAAVRPRGLPIGNLTSQFWANVYLNELDHFVKRELRCPAYLRYVDDILLFDDDIDQLWKWRAGVGGYLVHLRLTLHGQRAQPRPVTEGIPFLGFIVYPTHRRLKRRKGILFRRRLRERLAAYRRGEISFKELDASIQGWVNHVGHGDTWGLRRALLSSIILPSSVATHPGGRP